MKKVIFGTFLFCFFAVASFGQDEFDVENGPISDRINAKKMAFFTDKLQLTTEEFQNFWPLFSEFESKQKAVRKKYKSSKSFKFMSDAEAEQHVQNSFKAEQEILNIKKEYFEKFKTVLPIRKIAMINRVNRQFKEALLRQMRKRAQGNNNIRKN